MPFIETILRGGRVSLGLSDRLLADIKPETFASKPRFGSTIVNANHPAFVFGHLATYPVAWLSVCGLAPVPAAAAPAAPSRAHTSKAPRA